jgi:hypothetical protein
LVRESPQKIRKKSARTHSSSTLVNGKRPGHLRLAAHWPRCSARTNRLCKARLGFKCPGAHRPMPKHGVGEQRDRHSLDRARGSRGTSFRISLRSSLGRPGRSMARRLVATVVVGSVIEQRRYRLGSGAATLSDALLSAGWSDVTVLDVSTQALGIGADRFGDCRTDVSSVTADVLSFRAHRSYDAPPRPTPVQACPDRFDVSGRAERRRPSSGDGLDLCPEATQV